MSEFFKTNPGIPPESNFNVEREEQWEDAVFLRAVEFTVFRKVGRFKRDRKHFSDYCAAVIEAWNDPTALVYAVTENGRQVCLVPKRWAHYLLLWKEKLQMK